MQTTITRDPTRVQMQAALERTQEIVSLLAEKIGDADEACFQYPFADRVEKIETEARDGFIPWTHGGHHVCLAAAVSHHQSTGCAPAAIQPYIDEGERMIAEEWARQHPERPALWDCINAGPGEPGYEWQGEAEEWECEAWAHDDDCYFWKARAMIHAPGDLQNESGEWEVYVDAYLNTDINYGRDHIAWLSCYGGNPNCTVGDFKRTIPLADFIQLDTAALEAIVNEAIAAL